MTYCVGLLLRDGLVMLADTRTNAGLDNVSTFAKLHVLESPGDRVIAIATAGNLAVTQSVMSLLQEGVDTADGNVETLRSVPTMFRAAQLVGTAIRRVYQSDATTMQAQNVAFDVSMLLAGQIRGEPMRLFHLYAAGNFIEAAPDTPFLQIGEHKYGKPILDRAVQHDTDLESGVKLVLISMDSTLRSNLTVGLPADLLVYRRDTLGGALRRRVTEEDPYFRLIRERWSAALRDAYRSIPPADWLG